MSFDDRTRNALARMVGAVRERLREDITAQLQSDYRLQPDGTALPLDGMTEDQRQAASELRDLLDHLAASEAGPVVRRRAAAYDRMVREIGFTVLNRLAALRLCEERGLVVECVRRGMASEGFQLFDRLANGALGPRYATYRAFLEGLFDELALDLGVLFDQHTPQSHVFPGERALEDILARLNEPDLAGVWREDETIGWIYQYYNDPAERKRMREQSQAPRNSRELAVRNQFFTPRYVVEFLTDNTLARIWYEMTHGETALKETCRYLVRRPTEVFMVQGQEAPQTQEPGGEITQEEHLKQPVYIPYRALKDPRDIKMLDPACGSMHFGLYAFDLYQCIYQEAWDLEGELGAEGLLRPEGTKPLRETYASKEALLRDVPRLIIAHNIHGIDIDPRAVQIAGLSLWLRAQRSWQTQGPKPTERPRIERSNVVCAEPMPGERDMLDEFVAGLEREELRQLVPFVFERMQLAGEAGSLLKIEEDLRQKIEELRKRAGPLFAQGDFWDNAEDRVLEALRAYAERAENGAGYRRRLFATDAARGFAFIDLCRQRYDVVLMNPPFGLATPVAFENLRNDMPDTFVELYASFVLRATKYIQMNHAALEPMMESTWAGAALQRSKKSWVALMSA